MKYLIPALSLLLLSCNDAGADGYKFGEPTMDRRQIEVTVIVYDDLEALKETYIAETQKGDLVGVALEYNPEDIELYAFSFLGKYEPTCEIHILNPTTNYTPEWIGHEFTHCMYGEWHN